MKYIIDVPEDRISAGRLRVLADMENSMTYWIETGIRVTPYEEPSGTVEDVWKMVCHILKSPDVGGMSLDNLEECFGTNSLSHIGEMSYVEVREKYDTWKKQKDEIHVGDEVYKDGGATGIVTLIEKRKTDELCYHIVDSNGHVWCLGDKVTRKTGRHFPEAAELLKKMRETE